MFRAPRVQMSLASLLINVVCILLIISSLPMDQQTSLYRLERLVQ